MLHSIGEEFTVAVLATGDCIIEDVASNKANLSVTPISKTEYLIRDISNSPPPPPPR
jgi:hypothetical protein